jgi:hypothetical protein
MAILQSPQRFILLIINNTTHNFNHNFNHNLRHTEEKPHFYLIDREFNSNYSLLINYHGPELNLNANPNLHVQTIKRQSAKTNTEIKTELATSCLILAYLLHGCLHHQQPYLTHTLDQLLLDHPIQALLLAQKLEHSPIGIHSTENSRCAQRLFFLHMNEKRQVKTLDQLKNKPHDLLCLFNFEHAESQTILQDYLNKHLTHRFCLGNFINTYLRTRESISPLLDLWQRTSGYSFALTWLYQLWHQFYENYPQNWLKLTHPYSLPTSFHIVHREEDIQWAIAPQQTAIRDYYFYLLCQDYPRWENAEQNGFRHHVLSHLGPSPRHQSTLIYILCYLLNYSVESILIDLQDRIEILDTKTIAYGIATHCLQSQAPLLILLEKMQGFSEEHLDAIFESLRNHPDADAIHQTIPQTISRDSGNPFNLINLINLINFSKKFSDLFFKHLILFNQTYNSARAELLIHGLKNQHKQNSLLETLFSHGVHDDRYIAGVLNSLYYCAKRWMQDFQGLENEDTLIYQFLIMNFFQHLDQANYIINSWQLCDWLTKLDNDFPYLRARLPASQSLNQNRLFKPKKSSTTVLDKKKFHISSEITHIKKPNKDPNINSDEATSSTSPAHLI